MPEAPPLETDTHARLHKLSDRLSTLSREVTAFWNEHGPDHGHGGFHGTLDRRGQPTDPTTKGLVQQARHLWTWSMWYREREPTARIQSLANGAFEFLVRHFHDPASKEFSFRVYQAGAPEDTRKILYAQSFAIYGLSEYARAFRNNRAQQLALDCFRAIDARAHDPEYLGYDQVNDAPWLSDGCRKETNTHLHLLEAFTTLFEVSGDATVKSRLNELVDVFIHNITQPAGYLHLEFSRDWQPLGTPAVSYGHDLETAWLLREALGALGRTNDASALATLTRLAQHSATWGFDLELGGYFEEGVPGSATPTKLEKIWWIQAEALAGLFCLFEQTNDLAVLRLLEGTLSFIESKQRNLATGEWFWGILPDGSVGPRGDHLGEEWKTPYHNLRALVYTQNWIRNWLAQNASD